MASIAQTHTETPALPHLLTGEQVAHRLGLSRERVRQLATRPDFPRAIGRIGQAVVWRDEDVDAYKDGRRAFLAVNRIPIDMDRARELAARLRKDRSQRRPPALEVAAAIESLLDTGGAVEVTEVEGLAVFAALQKWLEDIDIDVFGEQLMSLRYRLFGELQDAGLIPR